MKPLSIIVPTLNEQDYLPVLLESLINQDYAGVYEVIIVDGNSNDRTIETVQRYKKYLPSLSSYVHHKGSSRQRNYGVTKARYDDIVFLDADMQVTKHALKNIAKQIATKEDFIAMPLICTYDGKMIDLFFVAISYLYFICVQRTNPIATGMCIVTTKQVHNRVGGFNEQLTHAEDIDYGFRAHCSGFRSYIFFSVIVRTSARRLDQLGRIRVASTWRKWYKNMIKHNSVGKSNAQYDFGKFKKD